MYLIAIILKKKNNQSDSTSDAAEKYAILEFLGNFFPFLQMNSRFVSAKQIKVVTA